METNVLRPGQILSGTIKRPGMNSSAIKYGGFAAIIKENVCFESLTLVYNS